MSWHNEMYNPLSSCSSCQTRFHRLCYPNSFESLCEACNLQANPQINKTKLVECIVCGSKGHLYQPLDLENPTMDNIHTFCLLTSCTWVYYKQSLTFDEKATERLGEAEKCSICSVTNKFTVKCSDSKCKKHAHPICAFYEGWRMSIRYDITKFLEKHKD